MGLLLPKGGLNFSEQIRHLIQEPLGWSEDKWQEEVERYEMIWQKYYHIPD
jgi:glycerol-3-phosphate dehydrogenase